MGALSVKSFGAIAVVAENLEHRWEVVSPYPTIEFCSRRPLSFFVYLVPIIVDVVYTQELYLSFTTTIAFWLIVGVIIQDYPSLFTTIITPS